MSSKIDSFSGSLFTTGSAAAKAAAEAAAADAIGDAADAIGDAAEEPAAAEAAAASISIMSNRLACARAAALAGEAASMTPSRNMAVTRLTRFSSSSGIDPLTRF